jgi:hypothetical protein
MHSNTIKKISENLQLIAKSVRPPKEDDFPSFRLHDGVAYTLPNDDARKLNEQVNIILKHGDFSRKFSEKYIDREVKSIFASILKGETAEPQDDLIALISKLESYQEERTVYLQVTGILATKEITVGNVTFLHCDNQILDDLFSKEDAIVNKIKNNKESKNHIRKYLRDELRNELLGKTISKCIVAAEPDRAYERAKEETRRALELFRYASKALYPLSEDIRVGLKGESSRSGRRSFIFSAKELTTRGDTIGSPLAFEINDKTIDRMSEIGVFGLSEILKKQQPNQFEESLLRAVHWFSSALVQDEIENGFLYLIIALETLLIKGVNSTISNYVAESAALILSDKLEYRKEIKKIVKGYYGIRSAVSHGGKKSVSKGDYYNLINIVGTIVMILVKKRDEFESESDLIDWIEEMKLA